LTEATAAGLEIAPRKLRAFAKARHRHTRGASRLRGFRTRKRIFIEIEKADIHRAVSDTSQTQENFHGLPHIGGEMFQGAGLLVDRDHDANLVCLEKPVLIPPQGNLIAHRRGRFSEFPGCLEVEEISDWRVDPAGLPAELLVRPRFVLRLGRSVAIDREEGPPTITRQRWIIALQALARLTIGVLDRALGESPMISFSQPVFYGLLDQALVTCRHRGHAGK